MQIRTAEPDDLEALRVLAEQLGYPSTAAEIRERLALLLADPARHAVVVAEDTEGVAGWMHLFIALRLESAPFVEIGGLVVADRARGRGHGEALVRFAEAWTLARGIAHLRVRSNVVRERAHRFYERQGFTRAKNQVVFRKQLS